MWLKNVLTTFRETRPIRNKKQKHARLQVEALEARELLANFTAGDLVVSRVGAGTTTLGSTVAATFLDQYTTAGAATGVSVALPTTGSTVNITAASETGTTVTLTATNSFAVGQSMLVAGIAPSGYGGTFTITAVTGTTISYTAASGLGTATLTSATATVSTNSLTELGTTTTEGYLTDSADGHSLTIGGYNQVPGGSTTAVNRVVGTVSPAGAVDTTTQLPSATGSVRVAVSADGLGFWVATSTGVRYVPFGNSSSTASVQITTEVPSPTAVGISPGGQLYGSAGAGAQSNGVPALDSPFTVGSGLPIIGGQAVAVSPSFPTARDAFNNFPSTNQFAISPDGNTIYIADSRTDSKGGILKYFQSTPNNWTLIAHLQLDNFAISSATESGTVVTITTAAAHDFTIGQTVSISGVSVAGYNSASVTISAVPTSTTFTYSLTGSGLATGSGGFATSTDGGIRALVADFGNPAAPVLYATTTATISNRLVMLADGGDLAGNAGSGFTATVLATAPAKEAFRGVALAPTLPGTTASTTSLAVTNTPADYGTGVTLTATVTNGATGWVSFRMGTVEIGSAPIVGGTAAFVTAGNLPAGTYSNITAAYTGDSKFAVSTSTPQSATINKAATNTTLTVSAASIATGVTETLTATVAVPAGTVPTGTVTFFDGSTQITGAANPATLAQTIVNQSGNPVIIFVASFTTTFSTLGSHNLSAVYNGDANFLTSTGPATVTVVNATTTTVTTSNASPTAAPSTSVTLTATVTSAGGSPTGTVQFYDDLLPISTPVTLASGVGTVTVTTALLQAANTLTPGLNAISAVYTPDTAGSSMFFTSTGVYEQAVQAKAFGASDVFVYRIGDGTTNLIAQAPNPIAGAGSIGSTIYVDEFTPAGTLVQSIILPSADGTGAQNTIHAVVGDGQQSASGQMSLSGDGQYLFVTGYDNNPLPAGTALPVPTASGNVNVPRAVARIKYDGTIQTEAFTAGSSGVQTSGLFNGVYSPDGNKFYVSGANGVSYFSSFAPSASLVPATATIASSPAVVGLETDGTNLDIVGFAYTGATLVGAFNGLPTAAATPAALPGLPSTDNFQQFPVDVYFTHLNGTGAPAGTNTMYISDDGPSFANGRITKWTLAGGSWSLTDTITAGTGNTAVSFYWLAGQTNSGSVTLYTSYGNGGNSVTGPGFLYTLTDSNGYNAPIGTGGTHSDVVTQVATVATGTNETFRGVALSPINPTGIFSKYVVTAVGGNNLVAGNAFLFTIQAADVFGNPAASYPGPSTVTIATSPSDAQGSFPTSGSLNSSGFGFFLGNFKTAGTYTINTTGGTFSGTSASLTVAPAAASYFTVTAPATATTGSAFSVTVKAFDSFGNAASGYTGTVHFTSSDAAAGLPANYTFTAGDAGVHVFSGVNGVTFNTAGNQTVTATDTKASPPVITGTSNTITVSGLQVLPGVTGFTQTATGFVVTFNKPVDTTKVTMFGVGAVAQDVILTGAKSGVISGTLLFDSTGTVATFKATALQLNLFAQSAGVGDSVVLPDDSYTVTVVSGTGTGAAANGFFDTATPPQPLNGGTNYTNTFTTTFQSTSKPVLGITSDFARGPDGSSTIVLPTNFNTATSSFTIGHGIPIELYNASGVTDVTFTLNFNPALLAVTGGSTADSSGTGTKAFTMTSSTANSATFHYTNTTGQTGNVILGDITADDPSSSVNQYGVKELLTLSGVTVNTAAFTGVTTSAVHVNTYVGDVSGDGVISAADVNPLFQVATGGATGFNAYSLLDPTIVGDVDVSGAIDGGDVAYLKAYQLNHTSRPKIPVPPGLTGIVSPSAVDPTLSLAAPQIAGGIVNVPVLVDHPHPEGSTGLTEAMLSLTYDPSVLSLSAKDITLGSLPGLAGWQLSAVVDPTTGQIGIELFSQTPITSLQGGSLVNIAFHVQPGASVPASTVQLVNSVNPDGQQFSTILADTMSGLIVSRGTDRLTIDTGATPVSAATPTGIVDAAVVSRAAIQGTAEETAPSLLGIEANDALAVISNGAVVGESAGVSPRVAPANVLVTGALAFQQNAVAVAATQLAGQVFQIGNAPLANALLTGNGSQQLMDRVFLALARWTDTAGDLAQINQWQDSILGQDWLAIPTQSQATGSQAGTQDAQSPEQQVVTERIAVVAQVFANLADETDDFSDLGGY